MQSCSPLICNTPSGQSPAAPSVHLCPACGQRAKKVKRLTMESLLRPGLPSRIGNTQYYFCETQTCPVVYFPFDASAAVFQKVNLRVRVGVKETEDPLPICYCFDVNRKRIWDEIHATGASAVANRIKTQVQAGNCACEVKNPSGKCCLGNVTRAVQEGLKNIEAYGSREKTRTEDKMGTTNPLTANPNSKERLSRPGPVGRLARAWVALGFLAGGFLALQDDGLWHWFAFPAIGFGILLLLAALLRQPGCEINLIWARLLRKKPIGCFLFGPLDQWEHQTSSKSKGG